MKKFFKILLIFTIFLSTVPINTKAETLADYRKLLKKYQEEYAQSQAAINKTEAEIKATNKEIEGIKAEMIDMSAEIGILQQDIISYKEEIEKKKLQTKKLLEYLQLSEGENLYLEYAFGAEDVTDLIYRMSVVEQITDYNEKTINELNDLIKKSENREKEINEKEKELRNKQGELESLIVSLGEDKSILTESGLSATKQIELYKKQIERYEKANCGENDVIGVDCATGVTAGSFTRPLKNGWITSEYGMRTITIKGKKSTSLHRGVDITTNNPYKAKIYASAPGEISYIYKDGAGALCLVVEHFYEPAKKMYSSCYCHLSSYNPKIYEGMKVTTDTWLGYVGNTGISTGPHLHFEINTCNKYDAADKNCGNWNKFVSYAEKMYKQGFKGPRQFINFPKKSVKWTSR